MKPCLSAFLLLSLLLLDQSHFANAAFGSSIASFIKPLNLQKYSAWFNQKKPAKTKPRGASDEVKEYFQEYFIEQLKSLLNQTEDEERSSFSPTKVYFSNFGYLPSSQSLNNTADKKSLSAIETFQQSFNLPVTGTIDNDTIKLISLPRCAVPDMNFNYTFTQNVSWPKAGNQWFRTTNLTYGFLPESEVQPNAAKVFKRAFTRWANAIGDLNFMETTYDDADIKVGFYNFTEGLDDDLFGFSLITENPPSKVKTAQINFNGNMYWALPGEKGLSAEDGILDLESAAMHQIGHVLGFDHSFMNDSVMYPYVLPSLERKVELSDSDKNNIKKQYANAESGDGDSDKNNIKNNAESGDGGCFRVPSITTLSFLGFAYMLLMY